ncbi:MAG TPA: VanW family protein, partial [Chloroflexia bacterium]|nr:VanW family protein [Chloroflexia bacterium]
QTVAADVAVAPQDAQLTVDADGVRVQTAQSGQRLDVDGTWAAILAATQQYPFGDITLKLAPVPPRVHDADIAAALATVHRLSDKPVTLTGRGADGSVHTWTLDAPTLRRWLQISQDANGTAVVQSRLDDRKITTYLEGIAGDLKHEAQNATLALPNYATSALLTPDLTGQQLSLVASRDHVQAAAQADDGRRTADLVTEPVPAAVTAAQLQPIKDQLDGAMRDGLTLTAGDQTYQVKGADVALVLYLQPSPAGAALPYQVTVNDNDIARLITKIAHDLDHPAQDAVYRLVDNVVTLVKQPQDGQQVDAAATGAAIKAALLAGQKTAALTLTPLKPAFAATDQAGAIVTPQLLQADSTYYGGSSPERNWNVTLGASKLDGWLIAPGATFSLNDALGDLTLDAGFKMGWAILVQSGSATTIPAEAGGICQVATTLFHPVFWAGLPMVERHHHSYWIGLYGVPPLGMQGLDATISPPDWDFRFKNTTGNWLLIRARGDHTNLRVQLWGTDPGWRVEVSRPVITKPVVTDPIPRRQLTDKLAAGRLIQVEHAQDGFTSDIHRVVYDRAGTKLDDWHAQGTYLPSHNTFMIGTGPSAP